MKLAFVTSDGGESVAHLADRTPNDVEIAVVLTDDPDADVLAHAEERDLQTEVVESEGDSPAEHDRRLLDALESSDADLVCVDGFSRSLTSTFIDAAPPTVALHPSLLPAFPGPDAPAAAVEAGVSITGCTIALVQGGDEENEQPSNHLGPILTQEPVPVRADDAVETVTQRINEAGFRAFPRVVRWFAEDRVSIDYEDGTVAVEGDEGGTLPGRYLAGADRLRALRYGENPHQDAAVYADYANTEASVVGAPQRNEGAKALSYNNYNDADAALGLVKEFDDPAAAVIKHTNPAGCAVGESIADAYDRALSTDPKSAFGGVVALNRTCDEETATAITDSFKEVVVAPGYTEDALDTLREKGNLRVLDVGDLDEPEADDQPVTEKHLVGGRLLQERDRQRLTVDDLEVVTEREPTDEQLDSMVFAWQVGKHVKSNAIVFVQGTETVGVGAGQVSRVDAVELAAKKAERDAEGKSAEGAVMASDAFFPFPDGVEAAAEAGVEAVVQPGGSVNDEKVIEACDELGLAMAFTGQRAFRHD